MRAQGGTSATGTGAVFVGGVALFLVGLAVQRFGAWIIHAAMPPFVTGAVVLLIGFDLAPRYRPLAPGPLRRLQGRLDRPAAFHDPESGVPEAPRAKS